ncbi:hypothetical protein FUAX_49880 (plasmid) [Fulvitalea axinellae]|uniref:Lipocalin-like domain-containing protein n=1 Tax=Fulvitalea axinellae TaxID=1182444 RepID=A0AAU9CU47_9BACT|nr:hypothetical protein FUAX_49880 [Fulvitalea axinellae]
MMTRPTFSILIMLLMASLAAQAQDANKVNLIGTWENQEQKVTYEFKPDSSVIFSVGSQSAFINSFTVDYTKFPFWVDFVMKHGPRQMILPGLLKVLDEDTIQIEQFHSSPNHPVSFSEKGFHILNRKKPSKHK